MKLLTTILFLFYTSFFLNAQVCVPDHFAYHYQGNAALYAGKNVYTKSNDIVISGAILKDYGEFNDATDGMITVMTARGTMLWTKRYEIIGYNTGYISSIEVASDSTFLVIGKFLKVKKNYIGFFEILYYTNVIFKIDKYGNTIWTHRFSSFSVNESINSITKLDNGNFLLVGSAARNGKAMVLLMLINENGVLLSKEFIHNETANLFHPYVFKTNNGVTLIGNCSKQEAIPNTNFFNNSFGYYYLQVSNDLVTNNNANLILLKTATSGNRDVFKVENAIKMQGDTIMIGTNFSDESGFGAVPYSKMGMLFKTTTKGKFIAATGLYNGNYGCNVADIAAATNGFNILMDDGYKSMLVTTDSSLNVINSKGYPGVFSLTKGTKLINNVNKNSILFYGRDQVPILGLAKTEPDNSLPCLDASVNIVKEDLTNLYKEEILPLTKITLFSNAIDSLNVQINTTNFALQKKVDCFASCCVNTINDTIKLDLCNVPSYTLPWNEIVNKTGIYYKKINSINNCDSVVYYDIRFSKQPIIDIENPVCMGLDTVRLLRLSNTYPNYLWNGVATNSNVFKVTATGLYNLKVSNSCGIANAQIEVLKDCNLPIYFPNTFTPNNDGINDYLFYPDYNKNKFISIKIYNRFGQQIFFSNMNNWKWDGKKGGINADIGTYIYYLEVITPDKIKKTMKGTIVLIR